MAKKMNIFNAPSAEEFRNHLGKCVDKAHEDGFVRKEEKSNLDFEALRSNPLVGKQSDRMKEVVNKYSNKFKYEK